MKKILYILYIIFISLTFGCKNIIFSDEEKNIITKQIAFNLFDNNMINSLKEYDLKIKVDQSKILNFSYEIINDKPYIVAANILPNNNIFIINEKNNDVTYTVINKINITNIKLILVKSNTQTKEYVVAFQLSIEYLLPLQNKEQPIQLIWDKLIRAKIKIR